MKHITIIVPDGQSNLSTVSCIVGAIDILQEANSYWKKNGKKEIYKIELAGVTNKVNYNDGLVTLQPHIRISSVTKTNLIIVPASSVRSYKYAAKGNQLLINWIERQYKLGAEIASICTGAFMLAHRACWMVKAVPRIGRMRKLLEIMFPKVNFQRSIDY